MRSWSTARFQEGDKEERQLWNCAREGDEEGKPAGWLPSDARNWLPFQARSHRRPIKPIRPEEVVSGVFDVFHKASKVGDDIGQQVLGLDADEENAWGAKSR